MNGKHQLIFEHLNRLIDHTRRLSSFEKDSDVDIDEMSGACRKMLSELQEMMPEGIKGLIDTKSKEGSDANEVARIEELLRALDLETGRCIEILTRFRDSTAKELSSHRQTSRAIRAYNMQR